MWTSTHCFAQERQIYSVHLLQADELSKERLVALTALLEESKTQIVDQQAQLDATARDASEQVRSLQHVDASFYLRLPILARLLHCILHRGMGTPQPDYQSNHTAPDEKVLKFDRSQNTVLLHFLQYEIFTTYISVGKATTRDEPRTCSGRGKVRGVGS